MLVLQGIKNLSSYLVLEWSHEVKITIFNILNFFGSQYDERFYSR